MANIKTAMARIAHCNAIDSTPTIAEAAPSFTKDAARVVASKNVQNILNLLSVDEIIAEAIMATGSDRSCRLLGDVKK